MGQFDRTRRQISAGRPATLSVMRSIAPALLSGLLLAGCCNASRRLDGCPAPCPPGEILCQPSSRAATTVPGPTKAGTLERAHAENIGSAELANDTDNSVDITATFFILDVSGTVLKTVTQTTAVEPHGRWIITGAPWGGQGIGGLQVNSREPTRRTAASKSIVGDLLSRGAITLDSWLPVLGGDGYQEIAYGDHLLYAAGIASEMFAGKGAYSVVAARDFDRARSLVAADAKSRPFVVTDKQVLEWVDRRAKSGLR